MAAPAVKPSTTNNFNKLIQGVLTQTGFLSSYNSNEQASHDAGYCLKPQLFIWAICIHGVPVILKSQSTVRASVRAIIEGQSVTFKAAV